MSTLPDALHTILGGYLLDRPTIEVQATTASVRLLLSVDRCDYEVTCAGVVDVRSQLLDMLPRSTLAMPFGVLWSTDPRLAREIAGIGGPFGRIQVVGYDELVTLVARDVDVRRLRTTEPVATAQSNGEIMLEALRRMPTEVRRLHLARWVTILAGLVLGAELRSGRVRGERNWVGLLSELWFYTPQLDEVGRKHFTDGSRRELDRLAAEAPERLRRSLAGTREIFLAAAQTTWEADVEIIERCRRETASLLHDLAEGSTDPGFGALLDQLRVTVPSIADHDQRITAQQDAEDDAVRLLHLVQRLEELERW